MISRRNCKKLNGIIWPVPRPKLYVLAKLREIFMHEENLSDECIRPIDRIVLGPFDMQYASVEGFEDKIIGFYKDLHNRFPSSPLMTFSLANVMLLTEHYKECIELFLEALERDYSLIPDVPGEFGDVIGEQGTEIQRLRYGIVKCQMVWMLEGKEEAAELLKELADQYGMDVLVALAPDLVANLKPSSSS